MLFQQRMEHFYGIKHLHLWYEFLVPLGYLQRSLINWENPCANETVRGNDRCLTCPKSQSTSCVRTSLEIVSACCRFTKSLTRTCVIPRLISCITAIRLLDPARDNHITWIDLQQQSHDRWFRFFSNSVREICTIQTDRSSRSKLTLTCNSGR